MRMPIVIHTTLQSKRVQRIKYNNFETWLIKMSNHGAELLRTFDIQRYIK